MGKESSGGGQSRIIFLLIVSVHLVTSQRSDEKAKQEEEPPCLPSPPQLPYPSLNSCPNHLMITELLDTLTCTAPPPLPHEDGDLHPVRGMMSDQTVIVTDAVVLALLKSRNDKGIRPWEIVLYLMFPSAVYVLLFCEISLRHMYPRVVEVLQKLLSILFVSGVMAFFLPAEFFWVPLLCCSSSLLTLIIAPFLH